MAACGLPVRLAADISHPPPPPQVIALPHETGNVYHSFERDTQPLPHDGLVETELYRRMEYTIPSHGTNMSCWLYLPRPQGQEGHGCAACQPPHAVMDMHCDCIA